MADRFSSVRFKTVGFTLSTPGQRFSGSTSETGNTEADSPDIIREAQVSRKKDKKKIVRRKSPNGSSESSPPRVGTDDASLLVQGRQVFREAWQNRPGVIGFWLSMAQLAGHTLWILIIWYLAATDRAKSLNSESPLSWVIVGLLGVSLLLTVISMFVCLFHGLRRAPRLLPLIGFAISFFVGVLASSLVFMQAIRSMSAGR